MTAASDALWSNVAAGDVAVSFVLGNDGGLALHSKVSGPAGPLRIGAYATTGFGGVDAVVSKQTGRALGLPRDNALIVSAPKANSARLRAPAGETAAQGHPDGHGQPGAARAADQAAELADRVVHVRARSSRSALRAAASKLGTPYVWGAEGPTTFDCSGLVQWAYAQAGVRMPRVTHQQWVTGPQVPLGQAQPGDLLFWRNDPTNPGLHLACGDLLG